MFVVVVYDIKEERVTKVYRLMKQYLYWRQRSVFDGNIDVSVLNDMIKNLNQIIDKKNDSVLIYKGKTEPDELIQLGVKKIGEDENIVYTDKFII